MPVIILGVAMKSDVVRKMPSHHVQYTGVLLRGVGLEGEVFLCLTLSG